MGDDAVGLLLGHASDGDDPQPALRVVVFEGHVPCNLFRPWNVQVLHVTGSDVFNAECELRDGLTQLTIFLVGDPLVFVLVARDDKHGLALIVDGARTPPQFLPGLLAVELSGVMDKQDGTPRSFGRHRQDTHEIPHRTRILFHAGGDALEGVDCCD